jgi:hypothetical protein
MIYLQNIATKEIIEFANEDSIGLSYANGWQIADDKSIQSYLLSKAKQDKLAKLEDYYKNSSELRNLLINDKFNISTKSDGRQLVTEQLDNLNRKIQLGETTQNAAYFDYYDNGEAVRISYNQLLNLSVAILNITNQNFVIYDNHKKAINDLQSINDLENYDIKANFIKNQKITI